MRHVLGLFAIVLTTSAASQAAPPAGSSPPPPAPQTPAGGALGGQTALLAPIQVESLTLTPIVATAGSDASEANLLVLDEAMAAGKVKIREIADGSVNQLTLVNQAGQPVFVMAGEVILGGKQDRIIGRNTVIPANTTLDVPVFCVEHGRWNGVSKDFTTAKALAHGRLRGKASHAAQQDVWDEVATKNKARKATSASDTYRNVAAQQSDGTLAAMEKRVRAALDQLPPADRARMVGFAVALNGEVATVDVFGSPTLFRKVETKLVRSYLTEAIDVVAAKDARPPTADAVKAFMADVDKAAEQRSYDTPAAATMTKSGARAAKTKVDYKRDPAKPAANALYENYQAQ